MGEVLRSPGQPLDQKALDYFEPRFRWSFGDVRVHADARASASAHAVNAVAYTVGRHIVFRDGAFAPETQDGRRLLAHELTHVVQQSQAPGTSATLHRQPASDASPPAAAAAAGSPSAMGTELLAIADRVAAGKSSADPAKAAQIDAFVERLRAVARGNDAEEQARTLQAFAPSNLAAIEEHAAQGQADGTTPMQRSTEGLGISEPTDAAEIEATRTAAVVAAGGSATVHERPTATLHRDAAAAAAALTAFELGGGAEAEAASGPPGWVVGGLVLLAIAGLTIVAMASAGNVADTGIMEEARAMVAAGAATDLCDALAKLMASTSDSKRKQRIKATQKAKGCRHSRWS